MPSSAEDLLEVPDASKPCGTACGAPPARPRSVAAASFAHQATEAPLRNVRDEGLLRDDDGCGRAAAGARRSKIACEFPVEVSDGEAASLRAANDGEGEHMAAEAEC